MSSLSINSGQTITGTISSDSIDTIAVSLTEGLSYEFDLSSASSNNFIPELDLVSPTGQDLGSQAGQVFAFIPTQSGTYSLLIKADTDLSSDGTLGSYTLSEMPAVDFGDDENTGGTIVPGGTVSGFLSSDNGSGDRFEASLTAGLSYQFTLSYSSADGFEPIFGLILPTETGLTNYLLGSPNHEEISVDPTLSGQYFIAVGRNSYLAQFNEQPPGAYTLTESAPDDFSDTNATTGTLSAGGTVTGSLTTDTDHDRIITTLALGPSYGFILMASPANVDHTKIELIAPSGAVIGGETVTNSNGVATISYTPTVGGAYELDVSGDSATIGPYSISETFSATPASDTITGAGGLQTIVPGGSLATSAGSNVVMLGTSTNTVISGGSDTIEAGSGATTIASTASSILVVGGAGPLYLAGSVGTPTVTGGIGSTTLVGGNQGGILKGGSGGHNELIAVAGSTTLLGGGSGDVFFGSPNGTDVMTALGTKATLTGGGGSATMTGGGSGLLFGGGGNDLMIAGSSDVLVGGQGISTLRLFGNNVAYGGSGTTIMNAAVGGKDTMVGGIGSTTMNLQANDLAFGGGGTTVVIDGKAGNDTFVTGRGAATVTAGGSDVVYGGQGATSVGGSAAGNDVFVAGTGNFIDTEGSGGETFFAGSGSSTVVAGGGNDNIVDGSGSLLFQGGSGTDVVFAGSGSMTAVGGAGADSYLFAHGSAGGNDIFSDFKVGIDKLSLVGYGSSGISSQGVTPGGYSIALNDGTRIVLAGLQSLPGNTVIQ